MQILMIIKSLGSSENASIIAPLVAVPFSTLNSLRSSKNDFKKEIEPTLKVSFNTLIFGYFNRLEIILYQWKRRIR